MLISLFIGGFVFSPTTTTPNQSGWVDKRRNHYGGKVDNKKDVVITYETLFDILRREKSRDELQELPISFFYDLMNYMNEKNEFIKK